MAAQHVEDGPDPDDPPAPHRVAEVHPAPAYFSERLRALSEAVHLREVGSDHVRKLTPPVIHAMLEDQAPDLAISARQMYRYYNGSATPRIDVVYEIARLFGVSPRVFLPESVDHPADGPQG
jgi:hypothetical protein